MGNSMNLEKLDQEVAKFRKFKAALFLKVMKYDLNFDYRSIDTSIQSTFTIENTNDLGEIILPHVTHCIEMEFKKFMYINFLYILKPNQNVDVEVENEGPGGFDYYTVAFFPSVYIDRFWRYIIRHNDTYQRFCDEFVKGYVNRQFDNPSDFNENPNPSDGDVFLTYISHVKCQAYINYQRAKEYIYVDSDIIQPLGLLWPEYRNRQQFLNDNRFELTIKGDQIQRVIELIDSKLADTPPNKETSITNGLVSVSNEVYNMLCEPNPNDTLEHKIREKPYDHKLNIHAFSAQEQYEMVLNYNFPKSFIENIMNRYMVDGMTASRWVLEYIKFLSLSTLSKYELFPCDIVDIVWHMHMSYTCHYMYTIHSLKGQVVEHSQECCHKLDDPDQRESYKSTLSFYKSVFQKPPPEDIWKPIDEEFDSQKPSIVNINLYRMAAMHYQNSKAGLFLSIPNFAQAQCNIDINCKEVYNIVIRRYRRANYPYPKDPYNWRRKYKVPNPYKTSFEKRYEVPNFDNQRTQKEQEKVSESLINTIGNDIFVGGGLAIHPIPYAEEWFMTDNWTPMLEDNLYECIRTAKQRNMTKYNLDDIADCANANIDVLLYIPQMMKTLKERVANKKLNEAVMVPKEMLEFKRDKFQIENDLLYEDSSDENFDSADE